MYNSICGMAVGKKLSALGYPLLEVLKLQQAAYDAVVEVAAESSHHTKITKDNLHLVQCVAINKLSELTKDNEALIILEDSTWFELNRFLDMGFYRTIANIHSQCDTMAVQLNESAKFHIIEGNLLETIADMVAEKRMHLLGNDECAGLVKCVTRKILLAAITK